ncbi:MAG: hypothetical protein ACO37W_17935 [Prochlorotrichaceae cyanobacterium]
MFPLNSDRGYFIITNVSEEGHWNSDRTWLGNKAMQHSWLQVA